jgi:ParB-like chromosome segregation protein Spo0J
MYDDSHSVPDLRTVKRRSFVADLADQEPELLALSLLVIPAAANSVRLDGENRDHVQMLAECGREFPPIVVHRQTGQVIDGLHRLSAATARGDEKIGVVYFDGNPVESFALSVKLNLQHGLPLSRADRAAAAARIIAEQPHLSDRAIASATGLSPKTVGAARCRASGEIPQLNNRVGLDGRTRPVRADEGRRRAARFLAENPGATLRQIAAAAEIALGTARDVRERVQRGENPVLSRVSVKPGRSSRLDMTAALGATGLDLHGLRNDPSLRFTEAGRRLLRLIDVYSSVASDWEKLLEQVPVHCSAALADIAKQWGQSWNEIGRRLEKRAEVAL